LVSDVKYVLVLFSVLLFIAFQINSSFAQIDNTVYNTFTNETLGVSLEYPSNWEFEDSPMSEADDFHNLRFVSPDGNAEIEVIVFVTNNPSSTIREEVSAERESLTEDGYTSKIRALDSLVANNPTIKLLYNNTLENAKGINYYGYDDSRAYYFTLFTDKENFSKYQRILNHILYSFTLSDMEQPPTPIPQLPTPTQLIPSNFDTFTDDTYGIEISYPNDWIVNDAPALAVVLFKPQEDDTFNNEFYPEFLVKYPENVGGSKTLESYTEERISEIENDGGYEFDESIDYILGDYNAKALFYRQVSNPEDQDQLIEVFTIVGGKLYTVIFQGPVDQMQQYRPQAIQMFETFKINEPTLNSFDNDDKDDKTTQLPPLCFRQCMSDMQGGQNFWNSCQPR
jgi:hypothetical protein